MADHEEAGSRDPRIPGELFRSTVPPASMDLAAALGGLDRATRNFTRHLGEGNVLPEAPAPPVDRVHAPAPGTPQVPFAPAAPFAPDPPAIAVPEASVQAPAPASFDQRMREAEQEAREYLEGAKRRADSLVTSMVGAVEREATEIRRGAEEGIRARWNQVEVDATRHVENARRVAEQMVVERQERIAALSDGITGRASALTAGMDDADRVRGQFDAFVRSLSVTADQISKTPASGGEPGQLHELRNRSRPSAIAA